MMSSGGRSVFAVLDGLLLFVALEGVFYAVALLGLRVSFDTPTPLYLTCNLVWALLAAWLAGLTAAKVARRSPVTHGLAVATPLILLAVFNLHKGLGNRRFAYVLALNVLVPVCCILGAWMYGRGRRHIVSRRPV